MTPNKRARYIEGLASRILFAVYALAFSYLILILIVFDNQRIITFVPDDAGYFLEIAENVARGKELTFDGIHRTNGFQPLWLYTLVALQYAFRGAPETMMRLCMAFQAVLALFSGIIIYSIHSRFFSRRTGLISGIVFVLFVFFLSVNLMESALLVFMLALLFFIGWKGRVFSTNHKGWQFIFGIILGLVFLARLDTVFLSVAIFFFCLVEIMRNRNVRMDNILRLLIIMSGAAIVIVPYLAYNLISFGAIMPISGALKSSFPRVTGPDYAFSLLTKRNWGEIAVAAIYFVWFIIRGRGSAHGKDERGYFRAGMAVLSLAVLMHFLHTALFMKWAIFRWHFVTYTLLVTMVMSEPVEYLLSRKFVKHTNAMYWCVIAVMVISGCLIVSRRHSQPFELHWTVESYKAALWARQNTDEEDVFAMKDAGIFGYFSERSVINLDGVVNNMAYQEVLKEKKLNEYLRKQRVRYLVKHAFFYRDDITSGEYESCPVTYFSYKYNQYSDEIILRKSDEVYRSDPYINESHRTVFLIFGMLDSQR